MSPRDWMKSGRDPIVAGYCDFCGRAIKGETRTSRGDVRRYCARECKANARRLALSVGAMLYHQTMVARVYKHADPARANAARSEVSAWFRSHIAEIDKRRAADAASDGEERMTVAQARAIARDGNNWGWR